MSLADADMLTEYQMARLMEAYLGRKRFEAKVFWAALGEALGGGKKGEQMGLGSLAMLGFGIKGPKS